MKYLNETIPYPENLMEDFSSEINFILKKIWDEEDSLEGFMQQSEDLISEIKKEAHE